MWEWIYGWVIAVFGNTNVQAGLIALGVAYATTKIQLRQDKREREKDLEPVLDCVITKQGPSGELWEIEIRMTNNWPYRAVLQSVSVHRPASALLFNYNDVERPDGAGGRRVDISPKPQTGSRAVDINYSVDPAGPASGRRAFGKPMKDRTGKIHTSIYLHRPPDEAGQRLELTVMVTGQGPTPEPYTYPIVREFPE